MAQNHDQRRFEEIDRVFEARKAIVIDEIASDANNEEIARPLIEDQFRRHTRICTSQDGGERMLGFGQSRAADGKIRPGALAGNITCIAFHEALQRLVGRHRRFASNGRHGARCHGGKAAQQHGATGRCEGF
jgi:hypothetical protein